MHPLVVVVVVATVMVVGVATLPMHWRRGGRHPPLRGCIHPESLSKYNITNYTLESTNNN